MAAPQQGEEGAQDRGHAMPTHQGPEDQTKGEASGGLLVRARPGEARAGVQGGKRVMCARRSLQGQGQAGWTY